MEKAAVRIVESLGFLFISFNKYSLNVKGEFKNVPTK